MTMRVQGRAGGEGKDSGSKKPALRVPATTTTTDVRGRLALSRCFPSLFLFL